MIWRWWPGRERAVPAERPGQPGFRLWHLADDTFGLPKADFFFSLRSPVANDTPRHSVLTQLYVNLVNDALNAFAYPADLAGLGFSLYPHTRGISVRISGYDDRQALLLERILGALTAGKVDPARFEVIKAEMERGLENSRRNQPYSRAMSRLRDLVMEPNWTLAEKLCGHRIPSPRPRSRPMPDAALQGAGGGPGPRQPDDGGRGHPGAEGACRPGRARDHRGSPRGRIVRLRRGDRLGQTLNVEHPESAPGELLPGR